MALDTGVTGIAWASSLSFTEGVLGVPIGTVSLGLVCARSAKIAWGQA